MRMAVLWCVAFWLLFALAIWWSHNEIAFLIHTLKASLT